MPTDNAAVIALLNEIEQLLLKLGAELKNNKQYSLEQKDLNKACVLVSSVKRRFHEDPRR